MNFYQMASDFLIYNINKKVEIIEMVSQFQQLQQDESDLLNGESTPQAKKIQKDLYLKIRQLLSNNLETIISYVILAFLITMIIFLLYSQGPFLALKIEKVEDSNQATFLGIVGTLKYNQGQKQSSKQLDQPNSSQNQPYLINSQKILVNNVKEVIDMIEMTDKKQPENEVQTFLEQENEKEITEKQNQFNKVAHSQTSVKKNTIQHIYDVFDDFQRTGQSLKQSNRKSSRILTDLKTKKILRDSEKEYHQDMTILKSAERNNILHKYTNTSIYAPLTLLQFNNILNRTSSKIETEHFERLTSKYDLNDYNQVNNVCLLLTTHNNARSHQIIKTLNSIYNQHYKNFEVVIVDRVSIDQTITMIKQYLEKNQQFLKQTKMIELENYSEVYAISRGIKQCKPDSISIIMNGNSQLIGKSTFKIIDQLYQEHDLKVAYSSQFILDTNSKTIRLFEASTYDESQEFMLLYRLLVKRYGNFFTFRSSLGHNVPDINLHFHGSYFEFTGADAFTKSVIEQGCGKIKAIDEPLLFSLQDQSISAIEKDKRKKQQVKIGMKAKIDIC